MSNDMMFSDEEGSLSDREIGACRPPFSRILCILTRRSSSRSRRAASDAAARLAGRPRGRGWHAEAGPPRPQPVRQRVPEHPAAPEPSPGAIAAGTQGPSEPADLLEREHPGEPQAL